MKENKDMTGNGGKGSKDYFDPVTNTLDIRSDGLYPSNVLSNLCSNGFRFEGRVCGSMEGFLQSLKYKDEDKQRQICSMKGGNARKRSVTSWQTDQIVWWKGHAIDRQGEEFQQLVRRAYQAMFEQSQRFRDALMQTRGMALVHSIGEVNPYRTILTSQELCSILTGIRDAYDKRDKKLPKRRKRVFINMDNILADCHFLEENRTDETPGMDQGGMDEMQGAIKALSELHAYFDLYILMTASWNDPSVVANKVKWLIQVFGKKFEENIVITSRKDLCNGDYLIDGLGNNGASDFEGEWIRLGSENYPDWHSVVLYLYKKEELEKEDLPPVMAGDGYVKRTTTEI